MTHLEINMMERSERTKLAARVRFQASLDDALTTADLNWMQTQIECGQVDRYLAHYVTSLEVQRAAQ